MGLVVCSVAIPYAGAQMLVGMPRSLDEATASPRFFYSGVNLMSLGSVPAEPPILKPNPAPEPPILKPADVPEAKAPGFQWLPAIGQASELLLIEHGYRIRTEPHLLKGPFWKQYFRSVGSVHGWSDHDPFTVNYIGHPMQGAVTGFIEVQNDPAYRKLEFNESSSYWKSKLRAAAFTTVFELQFEIGPLSEASIGHIQSNGETGIVDWVVTPLVGTGWMIGEDAIDKYIIKRLEGGHPSRLKVALVRSLLNPSRSFANLMRWKQPWYRDDRTPRAGVH